MAVFLVEWVCLRTGIRGREERGRKDRCEPYPSQRTLLEVLPLSASFAVLWVVVEGLQLHLLAARSLCVGFGCPFHASWRPASVSSSAPRTLSRAWAGSPRIPWTTRLVVLWELLRFMMTLLQQLMTTFQQQLMMTFRQQLALIFTVQLYLLKRP